MKPKGEWNDIWGTIMLGHKKNKMDKLDKLDKSAIILYNIPMEIDRLKTPGTLQMIWYVFIALYCTKGEKLYMYL